MKKYCFLLWLFLTGTAQWTVAQYVEFRGTVQDSLQQPIVAANVMALESDSQLMSDFAISDYEGKFKLKL